MTAPKHKRMRNILILILIGMLLGFNGCGNNKSQKDGEAKKNEEQKEAEGNEDIEAAEEKTGRLYILLYMNTETKHIFLQDVDTRRQEEFEYNGGTYIINRYGASVSASQLQIGELVEVKANRKNVLSEVKVTENTFVLEDIQKFTVLSEDNMIKVAGSNYYFDDALKIFSNESIITLNELSNLDTISLRGEDKKIHSIVVTNGHGTIQLKNTDVFLGGMVTVENLLAEEITANMQIVLPEGVHQISVANEGYGGSKEVTVNRFEELVLDLNELKGEGPKSCKLKINITPEDAEVTIAGAKADWSQLLDLPYGVYAITVKAEGYTTWSGKLVVNSAEAVIAIDLDKESSKSEDASTVKTDNNTTTTDNSAGSVAGSLAGSLADSAGSETDNSSSTNGTNDNTTTGDSSSTQN